MWWEIPLPQGTHAVNFLPEDLGPLGCAFILKELCSPRRKIFHGTVIDIIEMRVREVCGKTEGHLVYCVSGMTAVFKM
jgi:hypothetical protein